MPIIIGASGFKGIIFLEHLLARSEEISEICTYRDPADTTGASAQILALASRHNVPTRIGKRPDFQTGDLVFLIGWQFLLKAQNAHIIAFHDSLLPAYRGYSPTVTALIKGDSEIGSTAFSVNEHMDKGPIIDQRAFQCAHPMKIEEALRRQASLMAEMALGLIANWHSGLLPSGRQQDETAATYSLWRDKEDYRIDWSQSAAKISRFVDAVGYPYDGALTYIDGEPITIKDVSAMPDLLFESRDEGKVWSLIEGRPIVVCGGGGLLRIDRALDKNKNEVTFGKIRSRFCSSGSFC